MAKRHLAAWLSLPLATLSLAAGGHGAAAAEESFANPSPRVVAPWLQAHLHDADLLVVDARPTAAYLEGHVPGAISLPASATIEHERLLQNDRLVGLFEGKGIGTDKRVVIYDQGGQPAAPRLFWTLEYLGQDKAAVLDGGWRAWRAAGGESASDTTKRAPGVFKTTLHTEAYADKGVCLTASQDPGQVVLDTRSPEEFSGEDVRASRGGHVPGAVNLPWTANYTEDGVLKSPDALQMLYRSAGVTPEKTIVAYCQSGNRASVSYWVLRLLGYPHVRNYLSGWSEWGNDPRAPIEQSARP